MTEAGSGAPAAGRASRWSAFGYAPPKAATDHAAATLRSSGRRRASIQQAGSVCPAAVRRSRAQPSVPTTPEGSVGWGVDDPVVDEGARREGQSREAEVSTQRGEDAPCPALDLGARLQPTTHNQPPPTTPNPNPNPNPNPTLTPKPNPNPELRTRIRTRIQPPNRPRVPPPRTPPEARSAPTRRARTLDSPSASPPTRASAARLPQTSAAQPRCPR